MDRKKLGSSDGRASGPFATAAGSILPEGHSLGDQSSTEAGYRGDLPTSPPPSGEEGANIVLVYPCASGAFPEAFDAPPKAFVVTQPSNVFPLEETLKALLNDYKSGTDTQASFDSGAMSPARLALSRMFSSVEDSCSGAGGDNPKPPKLAEASRAINFIFSGGTVGSTTSSTCAHTAPTSGATYRPPTK